MKLLTLGLSFRSATVDLREKLVFDTAKRDKAINELASRFGCETTILSTCNRVEFYAAGEQADVPPPPPDQLVSFLAECRGIDVSLLTPVLAGDRDEAVDTKSRPQRQ